MLRCAITYSFLCVLIQFSRSVVSDSMNCSTQHAKPPCPSPTPGVHLNPCPWSQWCYHGSPKINKSFCVYFYLFWGFPDSSVGKESACNAGYPGLIPGSGRSTGEGIGYPLQYSWASLVAQLVKNLPAMQETWVWSLGWEDSLKQGKAAHCSILAGEFAKSRTGLSDSHFHRL